MNFEYLNQLLDYCIALFSSSKKDDEYGEEATIRIERTVEKNGVLLGTAYFSLDDIEVNVVDRSELPDGAYKLHKQNHSFHVVKNKTNHYFSESIGVEGDIIMLFGDDIKMREVMSKYNAVLISSPDYKRG